MERDEYKVETRANYMGSLHYLIFSLVALACTVALLVGSAYSTPMLVYNESAIYSCPEDALTRRSSDSDEQGRGYYSAPFTGQRDEDFFYDPAACAPFYADAEAPVWLDRVENLGPENQHLYIYGFVSTTHPNAATLHGREFELRYDLYVRGKNTDDEEWTFHTPPSEQAVMADCSAGHNLCTYFPVGYVPFIKFDMYDIAVVIRPSETLAALEATSIDFHVAYFDPKFTHQ